jgi:predicted GNAT family acetyltransferase
MTPPYKLQLHAEGAYGARDLAPVVRGLVDGNWPVPGVMGREELATDFAEAWRETTGAKWRVGQRQRVHELRRVDHPDYPPGRFRAAGEHDLGFAQRCAVGFHVYCFGDDGRHEQTRRAAEAKVRKGHLFVWDHDGPRSMATRNRPTAHGEAISLVFTPPEHRRRGYATAVVAKLSQLLLDDGNEFCTLYTDLSNPTSNRIYAQVGFRGVEDVVDIVLDDEG